MQTENFYFARATCPSGAGSITGLLRSIPSVSNVEVQYDDGIISITYDATETSSESIIQTVAAELGLRLTTEKPLQKAETC